MSEHDLSSQAYTDDTNDVRFVVVTVALNVSNSGEIKMPNLTELKKK